MRAQIDRAGEALHDDAARVILARLAELGWTQIEFARHVGSSSSVVSGHLRGLHRFSLARIARWTAALDIRVRLVDERDAAPASTNQQPAEPLPPLPPDRAVKESLLVPGRAVLRYTYIAGPGVLQYEVPCCDRVARIAGLDRHRVVCSPCRLSYDVETHDEGDGGHLAVLTVEGPVVVARRSGGGQ